MTSTQSELVLLSGASGLIGRALTQSLAADHVATRRLVRQATTRDASAVLWNPYGDKNVTNMADLAGISAAVHLSGANLAARRWTPQYKREISESRIRPTRALATMLAALEQRPRVLVSASAIGIYGDRGDEVLTEASQPGSGFIADLCREWEQATEPAQAAGIRVVHLRFGVVLSPEGGALAQLLPIFRSGLGGRLASGRQWMSWITLPDAIWAIRFVMQHPAISGPVNVVAPDPVTNADFTHALADALHRPAILPAPRLALQVAFGEMAQSTILASQRVLPSSLQASAFSFMHPQLAPALTAMLAS